MNCPNCDHEMANRRGVAVECGQCGVVFDGIRQWEVSVIDG